MAFDAKVLTSTIVQVPSGIPCTRELICVKAKLYYQQPYYHMFSVILTFNTMTNNQKLAIYEIVLQLNYVHML